jgi:murein L,D-transpeptidase YcbB/YkuD
MRSRTRLCVAAFAAAGCVYAATAAASVESAEIVRSIVDSRSHPQLTKAGLEKVHGALEKIYQSTSYAPIWVRDGRPTPQARAVAAYITGVDVHGLRPADYDSALLLAETQRLEADAGDATDVARYDTAITISLLRLLHDTANGRVDPRRLGFGLDAAHEPFDLQSAVLSIAASSDVEGDIGAFEPPFPLFRRLLSALATYRELAARADLPRVPDTPTLHPGEAGEAVPAMRARLIALGDLPVDAPAPLDAQVLDDPLVGAIKNFQRRHGLAADGVVGKATLAALRVPIGDRVEQIELGLERLRWLPRLTPDRFLIVNIPEFRLSAFRRGEEGPVMTSEVVVGSAARRHATPILSAEMKYIVFRPYWNVPPGIARKEILPKTAEDEDYLVNNDMEVVNGRIRQRPGANNSLGLIKFIFPNRHHVYLHDTPSKALFGRARRDFSHGCIRVARPVELAEFLLAGQDSWTKESIEVAMRSGRNNRHVDLDSPVPVYLLYSTVIIGRSGEVRFFDDIYGHDAELKKVLAKGPPYP